MDDYGDSDSCWLWGVGGGSSPWHWALQHARNYLWARGEPEASAHQDCAHSHMDPESGFPSFCLQKKLLIQVFALGSCSGLRWRWLGLTVRNGDNLKVLSQEEIVYASGLNCSSLSGPCHLGACTQIFREAVIWKNFFFFQQTFVEDFLWVRTRERLMRIISVLPWWSRTSQGGR